MDDESREREPGDALRARHDAIYATPGLPPFATYPVVPRVRAGRCPLSELDVAALAASGITHLLDLRERHEFEGPRLYGVDAVVSLARHGITRLSVPIPDARAPSPAQLTLAVEWLRTTLSLAESRVYVHCRAGVERTGTILLAWYALERDLPIREALAELRAKAPMVRPLPHQVEAARAWLAGR